MTRVLDACVLIAHFDPDDAHHVAATAAILAGAGEAVLAHPLTLAETLVAAVAAGVGDEMAERIRAMGVESVAVDGEAPLRLARLRATTRLRMPDCCVLDAAGQADAAVVTFDHQLAAAARVLGLSVEPGAGRDA